MAKQNYNPAEIEPRWQAYWEEEGVFRCLNPGDAGFDESRPKYYVLDMFPYPSGAGLHVGHPEGYTATDIMARFKRMRGFNVLHPMGWDAFGLPAEQHAIRTGTHPAISTAENINMFRRQLKALGFSYDWDREFATTDEEYFRWTQWIFSQLYERGLAYVSEVPVWWCPEMGTVLANEEVINGRSERGDFECERRPLKQWMLRITDYAERLLADLDGLDWPESVKTMQREWIGKSEGAEVSFQVAGHQDAVIDVFTTRPDTLFGASFMVLAPEHPLVDQITSAAQKDAVADYKRMAASKSELDRTDLAREMSGVFTGAYGLNPLFAADDPRAKLPVWIADYVIVTYGTGAIMAVPAGDDRDFRFTQEFDLPVPAIFAPKTGDADRDAAIAAGKECFVGEAPYINSSNAEIDLTGKSMVEAKKLVIEYLSGREVGKSKITYRLRDWLFSRQRYWGEPFPVLHYEDGSHALVPDSDLPITLPEVDDYRPSGRPEALLAKAEDWVKTRDAAGRECKRETNTMPNWAGSCWYYLRFLDPKNSQRFVSEAAEKYWMPVDLYIGGVEHAVLHLLYARFWHKVLYDLGQVHTKEPFQKLYNQGMILSFAYEDERGATVPVSDAEEDGEAYRHKKTGVPLKQVVAKMSKTLQNVVNPDEVISDYGADTLRLYEMFMGPLADAKPWNTKDVPGTHRFLNRVWRLICPEDSEQGSIHAHLAAERDSDADLERLLHRCIHKVAGDIERLAFNTAIAAMMNFVNEATKAGDKLSRSQALRFVQCIAPFAPHLGEELWSRLGGGEVLVYASWPLVDESLLQDDMVEMAVQILGKLRARIQVPADAGEDVILEMARAAVKDQLAGKTIRKEIVVKGRLVNFVAN